MIQSDTKAVLAHIAKLLPKLKMSECIEICKLTIDHLKSRINYFNEADGMFKRALGKIYDNKNAAYEAIQVLQTIQYEENDLRKIEDFLLLAELWFDMTDPTNAEMYVNRVAHFMHRTSDKELHMRYKRNQVRVLDSKREFILASQGYYNLSFQEGLDNEEIESILSLAITCTLLAPAGPRKAR
jgi:COP9 signalosome complex subunit 4